MWILSGPARVSLLVICAACFDAEEQGGEPVIGGVYVARQLVEERERPRESVWPLPALRVDDGILGTLLVKYGIGPEPFGDADFRYDSGCDCFKSKEDLEFAVLDDPEIPSFSFRR